MRKTYYIKLLLILVLSTFQVAASDNSFLNERYRGWFWYEENEIETSKQATSAKITPEVAKRELEELKENLDAKRFIMMARPTPENVKDYREQEAEMWKRAVKLNDAWEMANLLYPSQVDLINNPANVQAIKLQRDMKQEENNKLIAEFAKKFDLVLYFQSNCGYCESFTKVLSLFGKKFNFSIEALSGDGGQHEVFKTVSSPALIARLGISAAPTVIAVSRDGQVAFELIRGYVSGSELEEYSLLAIKHLKNIGKWGKDDI